MWIQICNQKHIVKIIIIGIIRSFNIKIRTIGCVSTDVEGKGSLARFPVCFLNNGGYFDLIGPLGLHKFTVRAPADPADARNNERMRAISVSHERQFLCRRACTLNKINFSHLVLSARLFGVADPSRSEALTQCWFNVGPASQTLGQHWTSLGNDVADDITIRRTW